MAVYEHVAWGELKSGQVVRAVNVDAIPMESFDELDNVPTATVQRVEGDFVWLWDATTQTALPVRGDAYFWYVELTPPVPELPSTRLVVLEVADTRAEDLLRMAIMGWNEAHAGDRIVHRFVYSCPVGDPRDLTR